MEFLNAALKQTQDSCIADDVSRGRTAAAETVMKDINGDKRAGYLMGLAQNKVRRHRRGSQEEGS